MTFFNFLTAIIAIVGALWLLVFFIIGELNKNMRITNIKYRWQFWSLYREWDYILPEGSDSSASGSERLFTLNPRFIWQNIRRSF